MQLSVRETSRRTPPAAAYFPFDFPRSFRAANRAAPLHTTRRSAPAPRVSKPPRTFLHLLLLFSFIVLAGGPQGSVDTRMDLDESNVPRMEKAQPLLQAVSTAYEDM